MGNVFPTINEYVADFIHKQPMFFVATAAADGHVNVSPKGGQGTLIVVDESTVAYLDLTGSGSETIAHVRALNRITLMWCAFEGPPNIVRIYGTARIVTRDSGEWAQWAPRFPDVPGARAVFIVTADRVSDSCGMAVPHLEYIGDRDDLTRWAVSKGSEGLVEYRGRKNLDSIDGLPALEPHEL
jgi:hypothetical protein